MGLCPFCECDVSEEILALGGRCPHCLIEIPGEEAPTDPGGSVIDPPDRPRRASRSPRLSMLGGAFGLLVVVGGAGVWMLLQPHSSASLGEPDRAAWVVPLSQHQDPDLSALKAPNCMAPEATGAVPTPGKATGRSPSSPSSPSSSVLDMAAAAAQDFASLSESPIPEIAPAQEPVARAAPTSKRPSSAARSSAAPTTRRPVSGTSDPALGSMLPMAPTRPSAPLAASPLGAFAVDQTPGARGPDAVVLTDRQQIRDMVQRVLDRGGRQLQQCYQSRLKANPELSGAWKVAFAVESNGVAGRVSVSPMGTMDAELQDCLVRNVSAWRFQAVNEPIEINKTYRFGTGL